MLFKILALWWCTAIKTKAFATGGREDLQLLEDLQNALSDCLNVKYHRVEIKIHGHI